MLPETTNDAIDEPFFILGAQRSGTTMLRLMLNAHPDLCVPFESVFITEFYQKLSSYGDLGESVNVERLVLDISKHPFVERGALIADIDSVLNRNPRSYAEIVDAIFTVYARSKGKRRWGDKTPSYTTELDVLWRLFPSSRVVHLVRDGRDVALSLRGLSWGSRSLPRAAERWRWTTTLAHKMGSIRERHYHELHYEDLVREPRASLETICEFLRVPFDEVMLDYHERAAADMPKESMAWHKSSVSPPDVDKIDAWKHSMSRADRQIFDELAGSTLELFGYDRAAVRSPWTPFRKLHYLVLQRW